MSTGFVRHLGRHIGRHMQKVAGGPGRHTGKDYVPQKYTEEKGYAPIAYLMTKLYEPTQARKAFSNYVETYYGDLDPPVRRGLKQILYLGTRPSYLASKATAARGANTNKFINDIFSATYNKGGSGWKYRFNNLDPTNKTMSPFQVDIKRTAFPYYDMINDRFFFNKITNPAIIGHELMHRKLLRKHPIARSLLRLSNDLQFPSRKPLAMSRAMRALGGYDFVRKTHSFMPYAASQLAGLVPTLISEGLADWKADKFIQKYNEKPRAFEKISPEQEKAMLMSTLTYPATTLSGLANNFVDYYGGWAHTAKRPKNVPKWTRDLKDLQELENVIRRDPNERPIH